MTGSWTQLFAVTLPPWELMIRGTVMYWVLFVLFRFLLRRDVGSIAIADVLLLVLIADASQNAMAGGYESITDGIVLVGTIGGWNLLLDWLAFRFPAVHALSRGYRTIVPIETCADKHESYHFANLTDLQLKYADVEPVQTVIDWLEAR